jgi:hypothetical protein
MSCPEYLFSAYLSGTVVNTNYGLGIIKVNAKSILTLNKRLLLEAVEPTRRVLYDSCSI